MSQRPPLVIAGMRVSAFAVVPAALPFRNDNLFVDGALLSAVPHLAIGIPLDVKSEVCLLYCDADWVSVACSGHSTCSEARASAERHYQGIGEHWIETATTHEQALSARDNEYDEAGLRCSRCGRRAYEVSSMFETALGTFCSDCDRESWSASGAATDTKRTL